MNLVTIASGWYNFITADFHTKQMMSHRLNICDKCPNKIELDPVSRKIITTINSEASVFKCTKCSCPLSSKVAAPNAKCPIGKWGIAGTEGMY